MRVIVAVIRNRIPLKSRKYRNLENNRALNATWHGLCYISNNQQGRTPAERREKMNTNTIADDGIADGGTPYTEDEMDYMADEVASKVLEQGNQSVYACDWGNDKAQA
jgi:hypothetical protein